MPNQRALAAYLGISQTTVARAIRKSPKVKKETIQRVWDAVAELGYRPNPMVTTLMEHIRTGKDIVYHGSIAILLDAESASDIALKAEAYRLQLDGFIRRAQFHGYSTEIFYLRDKKKPIHNLDRVLYARGVAGIIFAAPSIIEAPPFEMKFERYALASVSFAWSQLSVDRASSDHHGNVRIAFDELTRRGYKRIGLALPSSALNTQDRTWLGGFLACQHDLPPSNQLPVFIGSVPEGSGEQFRSWHAKWKPDALLCLLGEELDWLQKLQPKKRIALACLNRPLGSNFSGVEENNPVVGELACDIVVNHIIHNERGLSKYPRLVLTKGTWVEGKTLPPQKV